MDAANILKPSLARGELHTIGATTLKEYRKYFEKDAAMQRRFLPINVDESTVNEALHILRGIKKEAVSIRKHITSVHKAMKRVEDSKQELMEAEAAYQKLNKTIKRCPSCKRPL